MPLLDSDNYKDVQELRERARAREKLVKNLNRQPEDVESRITIGKFAHELFSKIECAWHVR